MFLKTLLIAAVATTAAVVGSATPSSPSTSPSATRDIEIWEGTIQDWRVDSRGVISIRLRTRSAEGDPEMYWFQTPGDRSGTTQFEDLLLRIIFETDTQPLRVHAARDSAGTELDSAMSIEAISSMPEEGRTGRTGR